MYTAQNALILAKVWDSHRHKASPRYLCVFFVVKNMMIKGHCGFLTNQNNAGLGNSVDEHMGCTWVNTYNRAGLVVIDLCNELH